MEAALQEPGIAHMVFTGKPMKGFLMATGGDRQRQQPAPLDRPGTGLQSAGDEKKKNNGHNRSSCRASPALMAAGIPAQRKDTSEQQDGGNWLAAGTVLQPPPA